MQARFTKGRKIFIFLFILFVAIISSNLNSNDLVYSSQGLPSKSLQVDSDLFYVELHGIKIDVLSVNEINVAETYTVKNIHNSSLDSIEIWINQTASSLKAQDSEGILTYEKTEFSGSSNLLNVYFRSELPNNSSTTFDIWYSLNRYPIAEQDNSYYYFEFYSDVTYFTKKQTIELKVPERSFIHEEEGLTSYFPQDGFALAGKRVYLSWTFNDLEPLEQSFVFVRFDKQIKGTPIWVIVLSASLGILGGVGATLFFMRKREGRVIKKISDIYLSETQKKILNLISENNGRILQKELCTKTGYSKSRISKNITPLVNQGLIHREKWGRNYRITLTESGRKVVE